MAVSLQLRASFESSSLYLKADGQRVLADDSSDWSRCVWDLIQRGSATISLRTSDGRYIGNEDDSVRLVGDVNDASLIDVLTLPDGSWRFRLSSGEALSVNAQDGSLSWTNVGDPRPSSWTVHLACIPTVNVRNASTKRYLCLDGSELKFNKDIAWGAEAVVTLEEVNGQYAIRSCSHEYLDQSGKLVEEPSESTWYGLVVKGGRVAFQAVDGTFLSAGGPSSSLASRRERLSRDEMFILEPSRPQVCLTSYCNDLKVAFHETRGDIVADGDKTDDAVYFQLESGDSDNIWYIRTHQDKLWQVVGGGAVRAETDDECEAAQFQLEYVDDKVVIRSVKSGKFVVVKQNGHLQASADEPTEESQFVLELVNRPAIVLQGPRGFVCQRDDSAALSCNNLTAEVFRVESRRGRYSLSTDDEKYWSLSDDGDHVQADSAVPVAFSLQFRSETQFMIQTTESTFLCHSHNTDLVVAAKEAESSAARWEYAGKCIPLLGRVTPSPSPAPPPRNETDGHASQQQSPVASSTGPQKPKGEQKSTGRCTIL